MRHKAVNFMKRFVLASIIAVIIFCFPRSIFAPKTMRIGHLAPNRSRLFSSSNPDFAPFFRKEAGVFDAFKFLFGIPERSFASMNLPDRIKFLSEIPVFAKLNRGPKKQVISTLRNRYRDRSFWDLVGVKFGSREYKLIEKISQFSGHDLVTNPQAREALKELIDSVYGQFRAFNARFRIYNHRALDQLARAQAPFTLFAPKFTIISGRSIQDLMKSHQYFNNPNEILAYQSASTVNTFEGGQKVFDLTMQRVWETGVRDFTTLLSNMQAHAVQGETLATIFILQSIYRMLLGMAHSLLFGYPIKLDPDGVFYDEITDSFKTSTLFPNGIERSLGRVCIGFQMPGQISFLGQAVGIPDNRGQTFKNTPALAFNSIHRKAAWGTSFSYCLKGLVDRRNPTRPFNAKHEALFQRTARILEIQMLGFVQAAFINGCRTVVLTGLGLGAFKNPLEWFRSALGKALDFAASKNMHVIMVVYTNDHPERDKDSPLAKLSQEVGLRVKQRYPALELIKEDRNGSKTAIKVDDRTDSRQAPFKKMPVKKRSNNFFSRIKAFFGR